MSTYKCPNCETVSMMEDPNRGFMACSACGYEYDMGSEEGKKIDADRENAEIKVPEVSVPGWEGPAVTKQIDVDELVSKLLKALTKQVSIFFEDPANAELLRGICAPGVASKTEEVNLHITIPDGHELTRAGSVLLIKPHVDERVELVDEDTTGDVPPELGEALIDWAVKRRAYLATGLNTVIDTAFRDAEEKLLAVLSKIPSFPQVAGIEPDEGAFDGLG